MVRHQMLCIVTPRWPYAATTIPDFADRLDTLFKQLGWVHFASLTLLPARADEAAGNALPSLMLEITIDEGLPIDSALDLMIARGQVALWQLYGAFAAGQVPAEDDSRAEWLKALLMRHLSIASCAFVGARDRTVQQIHREHALYCQARLQAQDMTQEERLEIDWLGRKMASWANATRDFDWAQRPAPCSFWRAGGLRRVFRAVGLLVAALVSTMVVLAAWEFAGTSFGGASGFVPWPKRLGLTLILLLLLAVLLLPLGPRLLTAARNLKIRLFHRLDQLNRWRHRRIHVGLPRAHQVHESIIACEAELAGRPNHIVSLTDVRRPYAWHAFWLRRWLGLISWLGVWVFPLGRLGQAAGIKYGHWHVIDGGRRLVFCSNYDGAFGGYLDEFIVGATWGVNLFWGNTELLPRPAATAGQPAVSHLRLFPPRYAGAMHGGCEFEQAFKAYARDSMLPHLYLFQAYTHTQGQIERATTLRDALFGPRNAVNDDLLARALES